ncbi:MFS family permease [Nocardioides sp. BE266]|uniref:MFS transporter n=1 Tax=Nocardioides sp. BE266 TaxID=2817725 RepID=UPI0028618024|nr:MFS transporter [Nocardioides sp. BE266]MDR7254127.1 MFS family permease [Nocardioides sp. BE266]
MAEPLRSPAFRTYWFATTVGFLGLSFTSLAVDVLVIRGLDASEVGVGVVRASQYLPYLLIGLVAGAYVDRWRRRPTLVVANLAQGALLLLLPLLWWLDALTVWAVAGVLLAAGIGAVFAAAAEQSYLPDLVPRDELVAANARLGQAMTVSQSAGPPLAGAFLAGLGASAALVTGALARLVTAVLVLRIPHDEPPPAPTGRPHLRRDIATGLAFIYRHPILAPLAISTHTWFLANSIATTVLGLFVLRGLDLGATAYGFVLAAAGVGGFVGAVCAPALGRRIGEGDAVIIGRAMCTVAWLAVALTPDLGGAAAASYVCGALLLYGLAMGLEDPNEMGYWQSLTPRDVLGRVNATRRSANRSIAVVGALLGGVLASVVGYRGTLVGVTVAFAVACLVVVLSPLRGERVATTAHDR